MIASQMKTELITQLQARSSYSSVIILSMMKKLIVVFVLLFAGFNITLAATSNIDLNNQGFKWAWNDGAGWIDFKFTDNTANAVVVTDTKITGSAIINSTPTSHISFDCATSPYIPSYICDSTQGATNPSNYQVSNNSGVLSGYAWSDAFGWISFNCTNHGGSFCTSTSNYKVTIDSSTGDFSGFAWNDVVGWISFNSKDCDSDNNTFWDVSCGGDNSTTPVRSYKTRTSWTSTAFKSGELTSNTFDTGHSDGVAFNSIVWQGSIGQVGNHVKFQLAASNADSGWGAASGDGAFLGPNGSSDYYDSTIADTSIPIVAANHNNKRYYRYKIVLERAEGNSQSPVVTDVAINYSP